jgi:hypothetical protein
VRASFLIPNRFFSCAPLGSLLISVCCRSDQLALVHSGKSAAQSHARVGAVRSVSCASSAPFGPETILVPRTRFTA